ncbi:MAG: DUF6891 domain-containing protein, partial [Methanobacteriaceae archaeon]
EDLFYDFEDEISEFKDEIQNKIATLTKESLNESSKDSLISNWDKLNTCFANLNKKGIITIHNAGYSIDDGIYDSFEVHNHLKDNNIDSIGFCFYTFEDVVSSITENTLYLSFGAFEDNKNKFAEIANIIVENLYDNGFNVTWNNKLNSDLDSRIVINDFKWDKGFDNIDYTIEYASKSFKDNID